MKRLQLECTYCGTTWKADSLQDYCISCRDSNLKVTDLSSKIDYYQGCPPFPEDEEKTKELNILDYFNYDTYL